MTTSRRTLLLLGSMLLAFSLHADAATKRAARPAAPKPAYTLAQINTCLKRVVPLVENAAGRKFRGMPKVRLMTARQIMPTLMQELVPRLRAASPSSSANEILDQAYANSIFMSRCLLGKYGTRTQTLYMVPENLIPGMKRGGMDVKYRMDVIQLIMAHELTHALQDQQVGLTRIMDRRGGGVDAVLAASACVEGQAMFVEDKVAAAMKLDAAAAEFAKAVAAGLPANADAANKVMSGPTRQMITDIYIGGRNFMASQYAKGGSDRLWQIMRNPPLKSNEIFHPGDNTAPSAKKIDYAGALKGLDKSLGKHKWTVRNSEVGELSMRTVYADMEPTTRDEVLGNLEHAQALLLTDYDCMASVSIFMMKKPEMALKLIEAVEKLGSDNIEKLKSSNMMKVSGLAVVDFPFPQTDMARKISFDIEIQGKSTPNTFVRAVRGRAVIELCMINTTLSDDGMRAVIDQVFRRLPPDVLTASPKVPE